MLDAATANTLVVIPARDEAATIGDVVTRTRALGFDVLVVDDCSRDQTAALAVSAGARVLNFPFGVGAWAAMQTGIRYALRHNYRFAVTLDADGQHDPAAIPALLRSMTEAPAAPNVIVGAWCARGSLGRRATWRVFRLLGGFHIKDLTSGYRLYDNQAMALAASPAATLLDYQDVGVLLLLMERRLLISEVDVPMVPRLSGSSRIFRSWAKVAYYLAYSMVLMIGKRRLDKAP